MLTCVKTVVVVLIVTLIAVVFIVVLDEGGGGHAGALALRVGRARRATIRTADAVRAVTALYLSRGAGSAGEETSSGFDAESGGGI